MEVVTTFEKKEGFRYPQPVERVNGKTYFEYSEGSFERNNWATLYWQSKKANDAKDIVLWGSEQWGDKNARDKAFQTAFAFRSSDGSSITPLFSFEVALLNNGFEIDKFGELNAFHPERNYKRKEEMVFIRFGYGALKFYFMLSKYPGVFQLPYKKEDFDAAVNGQLFKIQ